MVGQEVCEPCRVAQATAENASEAKKARGVYLFTARTQGVNGHG